MNFKITGRFVLTMALVSILVIIINIIGLVAIGHKINNGGIGLLNPSNYLSPEDFTREFEKYLAYDVDKISVNDTGKNLLGESELWIQILDDNGNEIYNYKKPIEINSHYTPVELINSYKYNSEDDASTIFISTKKLEGKNYNYIIGFPFKKAERIVVTYNGSKLVSGIKSTIFIIMFIDIPIALLFGYLFTRGLTKPLVGVIEDVKTLSEGEYNLQRKEKGVYKQIYQNINNLASKLRSNQEERKELDKMREEWISNISHDVKTPLVSIKGYAEILSSEEYDFSKEEIKEYSKIIEDKSDYIRELIDDLNLSTRLKNKALSLNLKTVNIVPLVRGVVIGILNDPKTCDLNIEFSATEEIMKRYVDEILIKRVITNLLYNSIVHNDKDISIKVEIEKKDKVHISIIDNGKGIKEEELKHIFERYYRGTNTGTTHKGSGLGMAIANDIIKAHNGTIDIKSQIGIGTGIYITL